MLNLIALRPVVPSHHLSPTLAVPNLEVLFHNTAPLRCRLLQGDNHSSTGVAGSSPSEDSVLRGVVHQLVDVCQSNQQQLSLLRGDVSQLRDELRAARTAPPPSPQAASVHQTRVPTRVPSGLAAGSQSDATCHVAGCSQQVSARCPVQFCRAHCTSSRCLVHTARSPTRSRQCRRNGCTTVVPRSCTSGFLRSPLFRASVADCTEAPFVHSVGVMTSPSPGCVVGTCERHCTHLQCSPPAPTRLFLPPLPDVIRTAVSRYAAIVHALNACTRSGALGIAPCTFPAVGCQFHLATPNGFGAGTR